MLSLGKHGGLAREAANTDVPRMDGTPVPSNKTALHLQKGAFFVFLFI